MAKDPKIVQMVANEAGVVSGVLYDDGRVFVAQMVHQRLETGGYNVSHEWRELAYPLIPIPRPPQEPPRPGRTRGKSK